MVLLGPIELSIAQIKQEIIIRSRFCQGKDIFDGRLLNAANYITIKYAVKAPTVPPSIDALNTRIIAS